MEDQVEHSEPMDRPLLLFLRISFRAVGVRIFISLRLLKRFGTASSTGCSSRLGFTLAKA